jgi:hypothetical protein
VGRSQTNLDPENRRSDPESERVSTVSCFMVY